MIQTIAALCALVIAVLFVPLWVQLVLFAVAVWVIPHRYALFIPAVFSDVLYSVSGQFSFDALTMTLVVSVLLIVRWLLMTQTRFTSVLYGMEA
jgi:hypothetical protein